MAMIDHSAKRTAILAQQDAEAKEAADAKQVVHVFLWTLFFFKIATLAVLLSGSIHASSGCLSECQRGPGL